MYDHYCNKLCKSKSLDYHQTKCMKCIDCHQDYYEDQNYDLDDFLFKYNDYYDALSNGKSGNSSKSSPNKAASKPTNAISSHRSSNDAFNKLSPSKSCNKSNKMPTKLPSKFNSNDNREGKKRELKNYKNLNDSLNFKEEDKANSQLDQSAACYTCEKSKFQTIQTYESIKYILMTIILVSIIDGLFTLNYQKLLIQHLQIILLKHKNPLMFCEYNKLLLFNDDKLRIATGLLYLINVSIQFISFIGISNDSLILTSSYAIYSIICFIFTIGTYLNYRRLFISLCINCLLAILSIVFSVMIKIVKPIKKRSVQII